MVLDVQQIRLRQRESALTDGADAKTTQRDATDDQEKKAEQRYTNQISAIDKREDARETKSFWQKLSGGGAGFLSALSDLAGVLAAANPYTAAAFAIGKAVAIGVAGAEAGKQIGESANNVAELEAAAFTESARLDELEIQRFEAQSSAAASAGEDATYEVQQIQHLNEELQQLQDQQKQVA